MPEVGSVIDVTHWQRLTSDNAGKQEHLTTYFSTTNRCMLNKMDNDTDNKTDSNMDCFRWLWQAKWLATANTPKFARRKMSQTRPGLVEVAFTCMFLVFMRDRQTDRDRDWDRERLIEKCSPREATHNLFLGHEGARVVVLQSLLVLLSPQMAQQVYLRRDLSMGVCEEMLRTILYHNKTMM